MHKDARFWALTVAIWLGLVMSVINIAAKVDLFLRMSQ